MTVLLFVLASILAAALVLALQLLRPERVSEQDLAELNRSLAGAQDYEEMTHMLGENLSADRGPLMREHLKRLRRDFLTAWAVCRLLAPVSQEPGPAPGLFSRWLSFHWLFAAVWVKSYGGPRAQATDQVKRLLAVFGALRRRATSLMQLDAGLSASGSRA